MPERKTKYVLSAEDRTQMAFDSIRKHFKGLDDDIASFKTRAQQALSVTAIYQYSRALVDAAKQGEQSQAKLNAVLRATNGAVGLTCSQLNAMADEMALSTIFDDDQIREAQAALLTFKSIQGDTFEQTLRLGADVSALFGNDLQSAILQLGKALEDPTEGLSALTRVGITFTEQEKKKIKALQESGQLVKAQGIILQALRGQLSGVAQEMNSGYTKATTDATKAWDDFNKALAATGPVKGTINSFLSFVTQSLRDMKTIIETGDWWSGFLFMLGFRGAPTGEQKLESQISSYREQIDTLRKLTAMSGVSPAQKADIQKQLEQLGRQLDILEESRRMMGRAGAPVTGAGKPRGVTPTDPKKRTNKTALGENVQDALGIFSSGYFKNQQEAQQYAQVALEQQKGSVALQKEIQENLRGGEEMANELLKEHNEKTRQAVMLARDYLKGIQGETDAMVANSRQKQHLLDQQYLEFIGLQEGSKEWEEYSEKIAKARDAQDRMNTSWLFGAQRAMVDYLEEVRNVAATSQRLVSDAFKGMEDALVSFVKTGKLSFSDLARSIIDDMIRIQIQQSITGPLASLLGSAIGGAMNIKSTAPTSGFGYYAGGSIGTRAAGGPVTAGRPYLVGENGPELMVPRQSGTVMANGAGGGTYFIDARGADQGAIARLERLIVQLNGSVERRAVAAVADAKLRGGAFARAMR